MEVIRGRNVNDIYAVGVRRIRWYGNPQPSRVGDVLAANHPVMSVYYAPQERVLLDPKRRANPFFHLYESLWMLSGFDDARMLDWYVHDFSARFAEEDGLQWGAYGHRWRVHFGRDQLDEVVDILSKDPNSRRVVISMWDTNTDLNIDVKDVPCNTHVYPRIVHGALDLTICCRSNDIIWGAYGANAVHFSMLQEYLAGRIGVSVGTMYQLSNNWHAYIDVLNKFAPDGYTPLDDDYSLGVVAPRPIGTDWPVWNRDLYVFMSEHEAIVNTDRAPPIVRQTTFKNPWFYDVALPMARTWWYHKKKHHDLARLEAAEIRASDWRKAALMWLDGVKVS